MINQATLEFLIFAYTSSTSLIFLVVSIWKPQLRAWSVALVFYSIGALFLVLKALDATNSNLYDLSRFIFYSVAFIILILSVTTDYLEEQNPEHKLSTFVRWFSIAVLPFVILVLPIGDLLVQLHLALIILSFYCSYLFFFLFLRKGTPTHFFILFTIIGALLTTITSLVFHLTAIQLFWDLSYFTNICLVSFILATAIVSYPEEKILKSEEELRKACNQALEERDRANELSFFVHTMAHDLNNSLLLINGYASILKKRNKPELLDCIISESKSINNLLERSLELAQAGKVVDKSDRVDLNLLAGVLGDILLPVGSQVVVENVLPKVRGDKEKITQVFNNIIGNAVLHGKAKTITFKSKTESEMVLITISNDGIPIPEDQRKKIFQEGYTSCEGRMGLGLVIVKRLVEAHGWTITLNQSSLKTEFVLLIPIDAIIE